MSTLIIAEAGVNHNGNFEYAKKLVEVAATCKVDIVKFQSFNSSELVTKSAAKAKYQIRNSESYESQFEMLSRLELSQDQHETLKLLAEENNLEFLSTGFDLKSMEMLSKIGLKRIKIPSGEITNYPYLKYVASLEKEVILSTGMSTMKEIEKALSVLIENGSCLERITVLHCTSSYPTAMKAVNLKAMVSIKDEFEVKVGYSDHTEGIEVSIAAVALGATTIEKHFTLSRELPGPDHRASLEPIELQALVRGIRNIEVALGDGSKVPGESELENRNAARKSIVASSRIKKGELFSPSNLTVKRPGTGISPMEWENLLGTPAATDYEEDDLIS
jgi:N,N'-diacetyllegionaminate synthase